MIVKAGSTDVTTYFVLRSSTDGTELTGATITNIDLQYVRTGVAPVAKVDATALAATDSAHADNKAIEIDATDQPGLYRVDWPDAAFSANVAEVILSVKYTGAFTEHLRVSIVGYNPVDGVRLGLTALPNAAADGAGGLPISDAGGLDLDAQIGTDIDAIKAKTDNLPSDPADASVVAGLIAGVDAKVDIIDTNVDSILVDTGTTLDGKIDVIDGIVDSILVDTAEIGVAGAGLTAINLPDQTMNITGDITGNLSGTVGSLAAQAKADVNAEVLDVLNVDTFAEPGQGTPTATTTIQGKIGYLYKNWRNKKEQTATEWSLYNDDTTTKGQKATVSDDATTATKGEIATGA